MHEGHRGYVKESLQRAGLNTKEIEIHFGVLAVIEERHEGEREEARPQQGV